MQTYTRSYSRNGQGAVEDYQSLEKPAKPHHTFARRGSLSKLFEHV